MNRNISLSRIGILSKDGGKTRDFYREFLGFDGNGLRRDKLRRLSIWDLHREGTPGLEIIESSGEGIPLGQGLRTIEFETDHPREIYDWFRQAGAPLAGKGTGIDEQGREFFHLVSPSGEFIRIIGKEKR